MINNITKKTYDRIISETNYSNCNIKYADLTSNQIEFIKSELTNFNNFTIEDGTIDIKITLNDEVYFYMCVYNDSNLGLCMRIHPCCIKDKRFKDSDSAIYFESIFDENSYLFSEVMRSEFKKIAYNTLSKLI